ncbi:MAG: DEAD/DEAH box helicase family protein [Planctomycetia bacterium]|nr:DEAD/DEAH box helicase family protein [Planctomycetia bacterium]
MPTPEQLARQEIDRQLAACGWIVQDRASVNLSAGRGVAVREAPTETGPCDYLLMVDHRPVGVVEAKRLGRTLSTVADQSDRYADGVPAHEGLPFVYESTGVETFFRDRRDPEPLSRRVFSFHRPETLAAWVAEPDTFRGRLAQLPDDHPLATAGLRACQIEAVTNLERSLAAGRPRALVQMATGSGKTFTACAIAYRLIRYANASRILFLVDRANLGKQTKDEFESFTVPDTNRTFTELYNVQHLKSRALDDVSRVTICTIQRLYSLLRGEDLPEEADDISSYEVSADGRTREVAYNPAIPIETFDVIITDECHRSIYNLWRQVLEYFDAFLIGLTATPSQQTIAFFNQNLVMEYGHERAVADGVNVGYDVYRIRTEVTEKGGTVEKGFYVDKRSKETRRTRQQLLDEDLVYEGRDLDRSVVVPSQIRTVLTAFKEALGTDLFPNRTMVPKTLIFAKDDAHAEDIVHICRDVFGRGNAFCKKITYKAAGQPGERAKNAEEMVKELRTSPTLRIAVTVDMIATGTDVKPLECLIFLRDVRSKLYFEQMKGRGTRVVSATELQSVSGADATGKDHFVIVDAVGVCESDKTDSRPLERKPSVPLAALLDSVALGTRDDDTLSSLASRLARLDRVLDDRRRNAVEACSGGRTLGSIAGDLLAVIDTDRVAEHAAARTGTAIDALTPAQLDAARHDLAVAACRPIDDVTFREALVEAKRLTEQTIDTVTIDRVISAGFDAAAKEKSESLIKSFRDYIETHHEKIEALQIIYSRPYKQRLTESTLKDLETKLMRERADWTEDRLWAAFQATMPEKVRGKSQVGRFADLVSLVRFSLEQQPILKPFAESVRERFDEWLTTKAASGTVFGADQLAWLNLIRDHIATSLSIEPDDFEYAPFSQQGGLGRAHQLFGEGLPAILDELNEVLAA